MEMDELPKGLIATTQIENHVECELGTSQTLDRSLNTLG